jgi:hypothetical protein
MKWSSLLKIEKFTLGSPGYDHGPVSDLLMVRKTSVDATSNSASPMPMTSLKMKEETSHSPIRWKWYKTFFPSLLLTRPNKLECLFLETLSSQGPTL